MCMVLIRDVRGLAFETSIVGNEDLLKGSCQSAMILTLGEKCSSMMSVCFVNNYVYKYFIYINIVNINLLLCLTEQYDSCRANY